MKFFWFFSFVFTLSLGQCIAQEIETKYFYNDNTDAELKTIDIINTGEKEIEFYFRFNNNEFFRSLDSIIDFILKMEDEYDNEPIVRKVWRFSRDMRYHNVPLSEHCWYSSNPTVLFSSTGFGFCGDIAAINYIIWKKLGYQARYWGLGGIHVVSEVFHDGKWKMYDSDVEVYYLNRKYEVASVEELADDIDLIYNPVVKFDFDTINKFNLAPDFINYPFNAYSSIVAAAYESPYKSIYDNDKFCFLVNYTEPESGYNEKIKLPPHSKLEFLGKLGKNPLVSPVNRDAGWEIGHYSDLRLTINKPWAGKLNFLPLIIKDIKGSGVVKIVGNNGGLPLIDDYYEIGSDELNTLLEYYWMPLDGLEIYAEEQVQITYFVNKKLFPIEQFNYLFMEGNNLEDLHIDGFFEIPKIAIEYVKEKSNFCEGETVELAIQYLPGCNYDWFYNEIKLDNVFENSLIATESGKYSVKVTSPWGEEISIVKSFNLNLHQIPELEFTDYEKSYFGGTLDLKKEIKEVLHNLDPAYYMQWYLNGEKIKSKNYINSGVEILKTGNYHVVVSNGNCTVQSSSVFIRSLYPENDFQDFNIRIFPNPFKDYIILEKIHLDGSGRDLVVEIFNSIGKRVLELDVAHDVTSIEVDASILSPDLYLLRISGEEIRTIRLIKK